MRPSQEAPRKFGADTRVALAGLAAIVAVGTYVVDNFRDGNSPRPQIVEPSTVFDAARLLDGIDLSSVDGVLSATDNFTNESYRLGKEFRTGQQDKAKTLEEAKLHVLTQAAFHQMYSDGKVKVKVLDEKTFQINGTTYSVDDKTDLFIADAIFEVRNEAVARSYKWFDSSFPEDAVSGLEYLHSKVKIESKSVFGSPGGLVPIARILQFLEAQGKQIPNLLSGTGLENVASFYGKEDPALFDQFKQLVDVLYPGVEIGLLPESQMNLQIMQDFQRSFRMFVMNGTWLRNQLRYFQEKGQEDYFRYYQAEYDFWRQWFGKEFSINGRVKEVEQYQNGDLVLVDDPTEKDKPSFWGVFFRPTPRPDIDPNWPHTSNGRIVRIEEGPELVIDDGYYIAEEMYRVIEVGRINGPDQWFPSDEEGSSGWVLGDVLGAKILPEAINKTRG